MPINYPSTVSELGLLSLRMPELLPHHPYGVDSASMFLSTLQFCRCSNAKEHCIALYLSCQLTVLSDQWVPRRRSLHLRVTCLRYSASLGCGATQLLVAANTKRRLQRLEISLQSTDMAKMLRRGQTWPLSLRQLFPGPCCRPVSCAFQDISATREHVPKHDCPKVGATLVPSNL
jgi:hypothetical protein